MSKNKLKEKILIWYDQLLIYDENLIFNHQNFWDEFFLLRKVFEVVMFSLYIKWL